MGTKGRLIGGAVAALLAGGIAVAVLAPPNSAKASRLAARLPSRALAVPGSSSLNPASSAGAATSAGSVTAGAGPSFATGGGSAASGGGAAGGSNTGSGSAGVSAGVGAGGVASAAGASNAAGSSTGTPSNAAGVASNAAAAASVPAIGATAPTTIPPAPDTVVRTGTLDVQVARGGFSKAFSQAASIARAEGGFVVQADMGPGQTVGIPDGVESVGPSNTPDIPAPVTSTPTSGTLVLRIPSANFDDARRQLEGLGTLQGEQLSGQDAGGQLSDLAAQIADLQAEQAGLRQMAERAYTTTDQLNIQNQLAAVQQQLDGLTAQQATLQNQVALSTITLSLTEPPPLAPPTPKTPSVFATRWAQAGRGVEAMAGGILVVAAYSAPVVALLALLGVTAWGIRRRQLMLRSRPAQ
jgi:hypothetical protein